MCRISGLGCPRTCLCTSEWLGGRSGLMEGRGFGCAMLTFSLANPHLIIRFRLFVFFASVFSYLDRRLVSCLSSRYFYICPIPAEDSCCLVLTAEIFSIAKAGVGPVSTCQRCQLFQYCKFGVLEASSVHITMVKSRTYKRT